MQVLEFQALPHSCRQVSAVLPYPCCHWVGFYIAPAIKTDARAAAGVPRGLIRILQWAKCKVLLCPKFAVSYDNGFGIAAIRIATGIATSAQGRLLTLNMN